MSRREAVIAVAFGVLCIVAGLTWAIGPIGLIVSGGVVAAVVLFVVDVEGQGRGEAVEDAARAQGRHALHRR